MGWIKGNYAGRSLIRGIKGGRKALVRLQYGKNEPAYRIDNWVNSKWLKGDSGANIITHYMWIKDPEERK